MMKHLLILLIILATFIHAYSQNDQGITTIILIRHAEKASNDTRDPTLSEIGIQRSYKLADLLKKSDVSAIYSTSFKRTQQTVAPLAEVLGIEVNDYNPYEKDFIQYIHRQNIGKTIVISGHSNTTPYAVNSLIGIKKYEDIDRDEYGRIFIVTITGTFETSVLEIQY